MSLEIWLDRPALELLPSRARICSVCLYDPCLLERLIIRHRKRLVICDEVETLRFKYCYVSSPSGHGSVSPPCSTNTIGIKRILTRTKDRAVEIIIIIII